MTARWYAPHRAPPRRAQHASGAARLRRPAIAARRVSSASSWTTNAVSGIGAGRALFLSAVPWAHCLMPRRRSCRQRVMLGGVTSPPGVTPRAAGGERGRHCRRRRWDPRTVLSRVAAAAARSSSRTRRLPDARHHPAVW